MTVRRMTAADLATVLDLTRQLGYDPTAAEIERRFARISARDDHVLLVADAGSGGVAGWVHAYERHYLESAPGAEIGGLAVDESRRNGGHGRRLMAAAEGWAAGRGLAEVRLRSNVVRAGAHRFYENLGYRRLKTQYAYAKAV